MLSNWSVYSIGLAILFVDAYKYGIKEMKNILMMMLEFPSWGIARTWNYSTAYGLVEGFRANDVDVTFIPIFGRCNPETHSRWLAHLKRVLTGKKFDAVFLGMIHSRLDEELFEILKSVSKVRVGYIMESLTHTDWELQNFPLANRQAEVYSDLKHLTHAVTLDEYDAELIKQDLGLEAMWLAQSIPKRFINCEPAPNSNRAVFIGSDYGVERRRLLDNPELVSLIGRPSLVEDTTAIPAAFDEFNRSILAIPVGSDVIQEALSLYAASVPLLRAEIYKLSMRDFREGFANINLPSIFKGFAGRIMDGMAAGVPAVTWDIPGRPKCMNLFKHDDEIVVFDPASPSRLAHKLRGLRQSSDLRNKMVENCRNKILANHTSEMRAGEIITWLESCLEPDYFTLKKSSL